MWFDKLGSVPCVSILPKLPTLYAPRTPRWHTHRWHVLGLPAHHLKDHSHPGGFNAVCVVPYVIPKLATDSWMVGSRSIGDNADPCLELHNTYTVVAYTFFHPNTYIT